VADRDVEYDIIARDKTGPGTKSAADNAEKLRQRVSQTNRRMAEDGAKSGLRVGVAFGENLRVGISSAAPAITPILAGVGIAAAPLIGASISGAIIGGAGVGGVLGGVILASRDARVQAAGQQLGQNILGALERRAAVFVQPVLDGIAQIDTSFLRVEGNIGSIFRKSSTFVKPLITGVTYAFERITIGLDRVVQAAGPSIMAMKEGFAQVGEAVEGVFTDLSDNGAEAANAITFAFNAVSVTITAVGKAVNLLTEAYGFLARVGAFGQEAAAQYAAVQASAKAAAESNEDVGGSFQKVRDTASAATIKVKSFQETLDEFRGHTLTLAESQIRAAEAIATTNKTIEENGRATSNATEKGRENNQALIDLANSFNAVQKATEQVNGTGVEAAKVSQRNRDAFIAAAMAAGRTRQAAEDLANQYLGIPKVAPTEARMSKEDAQRKAAEYRAHLREIPRTIETRIRVSVTGISAARRAIHEAGGATGFNAVSHFFATDPAAGRSRTGGPTPVNVTSNVRVDLDGAPFRSYTQRAIRAENERQDWRNRVGRR
jgi:hypothetical protein